jgi:P2 family phage contractile tail tube protein
MSLPRVLKHFNVFLDGVSHIGEVQKIDLPKLTRKMEAHRGGGMNGEADIDLGIEGPMKLTQTYAGFMKDIFKTWGIAKADGVLLRFAGSYQRDDTAEIDAVEVTVRGRQKEIDPGSSEAGSKTEFKSEMTCTYYKLTINGSILIEIDTVNFVEIVDGIDRIAEHRTAIGL